MNLIPQPRALSQRDGVVTWSSPVRVAVIPEWRGVVTTFAGDLRRSLGWDVQIVAPGEESDLKIGQQAAIPSEGFSLSVDDVTTLLASDEAGVSYGLTTLRQLGPVSMWSLDGESTVEEIELPRVDIEDSPTYALRGVHFDVARHFFDAATVCRLIDQIAAHRLNRLQLHLNDDQGWRIEIPAWPKLTEIGSQRRSSPLGHEYEYEEDGVPHGGFFTTEDIATIRAHAATRFVELVPEIDLPGHAQAAIASYPELGNVSEPLEVWTHWGISDHVLNVNEATFAFAEEVVRYVGDLFPGSPFHIGGDECPTVEWEASSEAKAVMAEHGFETTRQLQGLYTKRLAAVLRASGHDVIAWDEVLDAEIPEGTTITAWRHSSKGVEAAERGLDVIMAPKQFTYLDWANTGDPSEPISAEPSPLAITWETVYGFSVIPPELAPELHHHITGTQAQLWTEYIPTVEHLDYMAFPRMAVFSEVAWGTSGDLDEFRTRLRHHVGRLDAMGINYRPFEEN